MTHAAYAIAPRGLHLEGFFETQEEFLAAVGAALASNDQRWFELRAGAPITLVREDAAEGWIHVAPCGVWLGHPSGPFALTNELFAQMIENAARQKTPIVVDYEHNSERDAEKAPAAGWVRALELRDNGLWARVEYTDAAAAHIRAGEYRFSSGVFGFGARDRKSLEFLGAILKSIALTNQPFLDGQVPIELSDREPAPVGTAATPLTEEPPENERQEVQSKNPMDNAIDLSNNLMVPTGDDQMPDKPEEKKDEAAPTPPAPFPPKEEEKKEDLAASVIGALCTATGMDTPALLKSLSANINGVAAALMGGSPDALTPLTNRIAAQDTTIRLLSSKLEKVEALEVSRAEALEAAKKKAIEAEVASLEIPEDEKPAMVQFALSDRAAYDKLAARLKPAGVPLGRTHASKTNKPDVDAITLDDESEVVLEYRRALTQSGIKDKAKQDSIIRGRLVAMAG